MGNFVKRFTKVYSNKISLFAHLHIFINKHDELRLAGSLFSESML